MKSTLRISDTKGQDLPVVLLFLLHWPLSLASWMLVRNHSASGMMKNFQEVLMDCWNALSLPLRTGISLCLLMAFMTEGVILESENSLEILWQCKHMKSFSDYFMK